MSVFIAISLKNKVDFIVFLKLTRSFIFFTIKTRDSG